jgi:LysM repeat protein
MRFLVPVIGAALFAVACGGDSFELEVETPSPTVGAVSQTPRATIVGPASTDPGCEPTEYTVVAGDTLSAIAFTLGVALDAIIGANGIADPDALQVGDVLQIPCQPEATPTAEAT